MKIQVLSLVAALSFASVSFADAPSIATGAAEEAEVDTQAVTDATPVVPSTSLCMSDTKGVPLASIENNTTLMETLKPVGGLKGLFFQWETDGGSVKFFPSPAKRLRLEYSFLLSNSIAIITKVCKVEAGQLKLSGHVSGDPFVMFVRITSNKRLIKMSLEGKKNGEWYDFSR
jgi:hypothetical protein